jgi:hypothetical protein
MRGFPAPLLTRHLSVMPTITALGVPHSTFFPLSLFRQIIFTNFGGAAGVVGVATGTSAGCEEGGLGEQAVSKQRIRKATFPSMVVRRITLPEPVA